MKGGIPAGIFWEHHCPVCNARFRVPSIGAIIFSAAAATVVTAVGLLLTLYPPGSAVGATESNRYFGIAILVVGLLGWIMPGSRIFRRIRHPRV